MKKAKIMLATIALFAVVGGALAFKVKNNNFCCNITLFAYTSSNTIAAYTAIGKAGCFDSIIYLDAITTASGGIQVAASTTTFLTDIDDICTTLTKTILNGE